MSMLPGSRRFPIGRMTCVGASVPEPGDGLHRDQPELPEGPQWQRGPGDAAGTAGEWTSDALVPREGYAGVDRLCESQELAAPSARLLRHRRARRFIAPLEPSSLNEGRTAPGPAASARERIPAAAGGTGLGLFPAQWPRPLTGRPAVETGGARRRREKRSDRAILG